MRVLPLIALMALGFTTSAYAQSDWDSVGEALGREGTIQGDVYRIGFPRFDMQITLDGVEIEPGLALGTGVAFKSMGDGAMLMGDLVLAEDEVNPVMERLLEGEVEVTALHKHLIGTSPTPMYMHVGGDGDPVEMARTIRAALELTETPLDSAPAGGDVPEITFVMAADEVQPVLTALKENGIQVMPLHNHMLEDEPRMFFVDFWANGDVKDLARGLRAALDQIAIAGG